MKVKEGWSGMKWDGRMLGLGMIGKGDGKGKWEREIGREDGKGRWGKEMGRGDGDKNRKDR